MDNEFIISILIQISAATEYLNCVYTEVELVCGKEAALWQEGFDDTLIQPILKLVGCQLGTGHEIVSIEIKSY